MANLYLFLTVFFWGLSFIGTKMALDYLTPSEIIAVRLLLGLPVLILVFVVRRLSIKLQRGEYLLVVGAGVLLGIHFIIQAMGLKFTSATNTAWLIATAPVFVAGAARIFLKENLTLRKIIGILLGTVGVVVLVSRGRLDNLDWLESIGDWIILSSCITWAIYTVMTRNISRTHNPLAISVAILIIPTVSLVAATIAFSPLEKFIELPFTIIGVLVFLGVFCMGLAHWFWLEGVAARGATEAGVFLYIEPVVTTLAAIPLLGERITIFMVAGAVLILAGVYLVERRHQAKARKPNHLDKRVSEPGRGS